MALKGQKGSLTPIRCDVSKEEEILSMFERIKQELGGVDVCINNAGLGYDAPLLSGSTQDWRHMLDVSTCEVLFSFFKGTIFLKNRHFIIPERFDKLIYIDKLIYGINTITLRKHAYSNI